MGQTFLARVPFRLLRATSDAPGNANHNTQPGLVPVLAMVASLATCRFESMVEKDAGGIKTIN